MQAVARLLDGRLGVGAVMVVDVRIVDAHALQRSVEGGDEVFSRAAPPAGAAPHRESRLGGDEHLVAVGREVLAQDLAEVLLGAAHAGAVVVGEVEGVDALVEGGEDHVAHDFKVVETAEVLPQPQRERGELQTAARARAAVFDGGVPVTHRIGRSVLVLDQVFERCFIHISASARRVRRGAFKLRNIVS